MQNRRLGKTDIEVSPVGLGCWQFSQGKGLTGGMWAVLGQETINAVVAAAYAGGVDWFDTAEVYGDGMSERALSAALHQLQLPTDAVMVATKWLPILRTAANIPRTIDTRLHNLGGYPIGLYQVHIPWSLSPIPKQMHEMANLVRAGKIRAIGVSNFSARQMEEASVALAAEGLVLASNQVKISLLDRQIEENGLLETARRLGVTLIAYSPLAQGLLTGKFHADPTLLTALPPSRHSVFSPASRAFRPQNLARILPLIEELRRVATAHGVTPGQVALAWVISHYGDTVVAIPGATKPAQATESAAAMDIQLSENELARIAEVTTGVARQG
ncbi:MAG: aldo/keto reductase [bacterium]